MSDSVNVQPQRTVTIEGDTWRFSLTQEEYHEWVKYDESHPWLARLPYQAVLRMFLNHFRRGINLNVPVGS